MTPQLLTKITEEAERKYPLYSGIDLDHISNKIVKGKRQAHISCAVEYCEKIEKIREEVEQRRKDYIHADLTDDDINEAALAGRYFEAKEILSIIDKHLKP